MPFVTLRRYFSGERVSLLSPELPAGTVPKRRLELCPVLFIDDADGLRRLRAGGRRDALQGLSFRLREAVTSVEMLASAGTTKL
jgi:hypothetical protein